MSRSRSQISRQWHGGTGLLLPPAGLSADDEVRLARQIEAGLLASEAWRGERRDDVDLPTANSAELIMLERIGRQAIRRFVESNLRLVAMVSHKESLRTGLTEGDLFQEGCLGLLEAVRRFDHRRGLRFATYALHWIRAYIGALTATRAGGLNLPTGRATAIREARGAQAALSQRLGREATAEELSRLVGRDVDEVRRLLDYVPDELLDPADLAAIETVDERVDQEYDAVLWRTTSSRRLLRLLSGEARLVIEWRYGFVDGDEHSISDVARRLGLPRSRVRQHEIRALEELRAGCPQEEIANLR
jgi:RNA polymerase primary sigma factor/RNA polymerase nonessential primary-like sigma factor